MTNTKPTFRFRFQFGLRTFMIAFTLVSVASLLWVLPSVKQRTTVDVIQKCGLPVTYHPAPEWVPTGLVKLAGNDFFQRVATVGKEPVNDVRKLTRLRVPDGYKGPSISAALPHLKMVTLEMKSHPPKLDLEFLTGLRKLEVLVVTGPLDPVFPILPQVRSLFVEGTPVDGRSLTSFPNLTNLNTPGAISNEDEIEKLQHLETMFVGNYSSKPPFDANVVSSLRNLVHLSINSDSISGLECLRGHPSLERLDLRSGNPIKMSLLMDIPHLKRVVSPSSIPAELRAKLRQRQSEN